MNLNIPGLIVDVFDATLVDKTTKEVIARKELKNANITSEVDTVEITGGKGDATIATLYGKRNTTIQLTDPTWSLSWLAMQLGTEIKTGSGIAYAAPRHYVVKDGVVKLDYKPIINEYLYILDRAGNRIDSSKFEVTDKEVTIDGVENGDKVEILTYQYETTPETQVLEIDVSKFPHDVMLILETYEISRETKKVSHLIQYQFDQVMPSANFTVNTSSAREESTQETTFTVQKPYDSDVIGRVLRIPREEATTP